MQHTRPGDFIPAVREDVVSAKAAVALGVSLILGSIFWAILIVMVLH